MTRSIITGTTILTIRSALAQAHGAVNLGQGLPDFDQRAQLLQGTDTLVVSDEVCEHMVRECVAAQPWLSCDVTGRHRQLASANAAMPEPSVHVEPTALTTAVFLSSPASCRIR